MAPFSVHIYEHYGVVSLPFPQSRSVSWNINPDGTKGEEVTWPPQVETLESKSQGGRNRWDRKASKHPCAGKDQDRVLGRPAGVWLQAQAKPPPLSGGESVLKPRCGFPYLILSRKLDVEMQTRNCFHCKCKNPFLWPQDNHILYDSQSPACNNQAMTRVYSPRQRQSPKLHLAITSAPPSPAKSMFNNTAHVMVVFWTGRFLLLPLFSLNPFLIYTEMGFCVAFIYQTMLVWSTKVICLCIYIIEGIF